MARRGENIYKRKDGRWEGRYIKGYSNGKAKYGYVYEKSYSALKGKLKTVLAELETAKNISDSGCITFQYAASEWIQSIKPQLKEQTIVQYENLFTGYLLPYFKNMEVESITRDDVYNLSNLLLTTGGISGNGLSPKTVEGILSVLKRILKYSEDYKGCHVVHVEKNLLRQSTKHMRILSIHEQQTLNSYLTDNLNLINLGILLCLYTGIRIGEVCALKWEDFSFDEQYVYIHKTMQRMQTKNNPEHKTAVIISAPKSECSIRKIPLPDDIFRLILAEKRPADTYFLTGLSKVYIEPRTLQNRFKAVIKSCKLKDTNFHALRHTFATRCVELGFDVKSLSEILGHASINVTLNRYVHPSMETKQKNMNILSELFTVK